jgi:hypothetical protein
MEIFRLSSNNMLLFYHATIPQFAEEIVESGIIQPSNKLENHAGWNFSIGLNFDYGDVIYLASTDEKNLAIGYAKSRLTKLWEDLEDKEELYNSEEYGFIGLFKIYISKNNLKLKRNKKDFEYLYFGDIPKTKNDHAYWVGPEWISCEKELADYLKRIEKIQKELFLS